VNMPLDVCFLSSTKTLDDA